MTHRFGYIPDEPDELDGRFAITRGAPVQRVDSVQWLAFVREWRDQDFSSGCVSHGGCQELETLRARHGLPHVALSRFAGYGGARKYLGGALVDGGSRPRDFYRHAQKIGVCPEAHWSHEHGLQNVNTLPDTAAEAEGAFLVDSFTYRRVGAGLRGDAFVDAVLDALQVGPVGFGRFVLTSYMRHRGTGVLPASAPGDREEGGHYTVLMGFEDRGQTLIDLNSWGGWGYPSGFVRSLARLHVDHLRAGYVDAWQVQLGSPAEFAVTQTRAVVP